MDSLAGVKTTRGASAQARKRVWRPSESLAWNISWIVQPFGSPEVSVGLPVGHCFWVLLGLLDGARCVRLDKSKEGLAGLV